MCFVPIFSNALQTRYEKLQHSHKESEYISFEERLEELVVMNLEKQKIRVERVDDEQQPNSNKELQRKLLYDYP